MFTEVKVMQNKYLALALVSALAFFAQRCSIPTEIAL